LYIYISKRFVHLVLQMVKENDSRDSVFISIGSDVSPRLTLVSCKSSINVNQPRDRVMPYASPPASPEPSPPCFLSSRAPTMATPTEEDRAVELAQNASQSIKAGNLSDAARLLREANTIAPQLPQVQAGWVALKEEEDRSPLIEICKSWVRSKDREEGEKAMRIVKGQVLSSKNAEEAFGILMDFKGEDDTLDRVTGELLANPGAQRVLAKAVQDHPTQTYYEIFERGDDTIAGLIRVLLNRSVWPSDEVFIQGHRDCFMLSLAMMMEKALERPERAMKGVAALLAAYAEHLHGIIDADSFDVILTSLDIRVSQKLRSEATVATVQLLNLAPETGQELITKFVTSRVKRATADDLVIAFSAAAAIFPITKTIAAALFLTDGFVSTLVPLVQGKKSHKLEQATLELLSQACVDKACREAVNRHCREWLEDTVGDSADKHCANLAALVLVKLGEEETQPDGPQIVTHIKVDQDDLISRFKSMIVSSELESKQDSLEGLAFASLRPNVREELANDTRFLKQLIQTLQGTDSANALYGGLTILSNLTVYLPLQSEEDKRMDQLKAYANTRKPTAPDPLLDETHVTARCKRVLDAGAVPLLVQISKKGTPAALTQILQILLALSNGKSHRGILAQQGAVKLLIQIWDHISTTEATPTSTSSFLPTAKPNAAQALARILISTNPHHIFNAALPSSSAIRPLYSLLSPSDTPAWQLHCFESLLALTNLASLDALTQDIIVRTAFDKTNDDLLLSPNTLVRRAAVELVCNLMASASGIEKFADGSHRAAQRLHVLLVMTDVDDTATRSAAGGALAMLLSYEEGVTALLDQEKGISFLLGLCRDESEDIRHRGVVCLRSVVGVQGELGTRGAEALREGGAIEVLKGCLKESRRQEVLTMGVETLKILLGQA
jgi:hypothetical protein